MVATWKKDTVGRFEKQIKGHKVVAVASISAIPSKQFQSIKKKLKGQVDFSIARSNLIIRALDKAGIKGMNDHVKGPTGILFTNLNAFQLTKALYDCKTNAPVKPGAIAPFDLIVSAGDTGLPAGPVIGDLQAAGVKARIQGGKILVTEDSLVAKQGTVVNEKVASVLSRLGVEPMEILLKVTAAHEGGLVYTYDILHIDEEETKAKISGAHLKALNLAVNARVFNKDTMPLLVQEAICKTRNLLINAKIINKDTVGIYLAKADAAAKSIMSAMPQELQADLEKKE
jgi:large subunit ribosomal protein L10